MKKIIVLTLVILFIAPMSFARMKISEGEVQEAQKIKKKRYWFNRELADLKAEGKLKPLQGQKKVIVPYFRITFATGGKYINNVGGVTTSKTSVKSQLTGVEEDVMQQVTDDLYEDFIARLQEEGYEVLDVSILDADEAYQKLQESDKYPVIKKTYSQFTPNNRYFPGKIPVKAYMLAQNYDAIFLQADFTVNFIVINRNQTKFNILKDKSDVDVSQGINVFGTVSAITPKTNATFTIQQPIISDEVFAKVENTTKTSDKVMDKATTVLGWVGGSGSLLDRRSTNRVEVDADSQLYKIAAEDALSEANAALVSFMVDSIENRNGNKMEPNMAEPGKDVK